MGFKLCMLAAIGAMAASGASAADLPVLAQQTGPVAAGNWYDGIYVHLGPGALIMDASARISTPAGRYPGATIKIAPQVTATAEVGYFFTPNWAVSVTVGVPPTAVVDGAGTIGAFGKLGSTVYGPTAATVHYHFTNFGAFQPYVGIGPAYMIDFNSRDAALSDFKVHSAWGAIAQVGADYMFTNRIGVFVDFKKAYLRTTADASLGPVPIHADVKLDPAIVSGGMTYRF